MSLVAVHWYENCHWKLAGGALLKAAEK